jgi:hypothetical protein
MIVMKSILILLSMLALPGALFGQSALYFPRAFSPADLGSTGFAVVNPGPAAASVTFRLLGASGATVALWTQVVPARGQVARLGSEYFPNTATGGWVQATSTTAGLQGFWIGGDFSTYTDGADGALPATDQILPLVASQTEINIANPNNAPIAVTIRLREPNGVESSAPVTVTIPELGVFQEMASALFPNASLTAPMHIRVNSDGMFVTTSVVRGLLVPTDTGVVNGVAVNTATPVMNFPHAVSGPLGGQNYSTVVGITNLASTAQTMTISFTRQTGGTLTAQRVVDGNGTFRETVQSLFNLSLFENGWIKVTALAPITGIVAYAETTLGAFAVVPVQVTPRANLLFLHVADLDPWATGLALLNATTSPANVEVFAMYPDGGLIGGPETASTASFTLNPGEKISKLLGPEIIGKSAGSGFVFVRTTNDIPLYGVELFFSRSNSIFANVAAGSLAPGTTFTPPVLSVLTPGPSTQSTRGSILTLTGTNFSLIASNNIVEFTTTTGTVDVPASTSTATSLTVVVPSEAISGPVRVKVNGQPTALSILEVTASPTSLDQNRFHVSDGQTLSGMDVYVPMSRGEVLNATRVGVASTGAATFTFAGSAHLDRGQTVDLTVAGVGISEANGSRISFSGEGLTASNVRFESSGGTSMIIVTIAVDANAEVGPRNIGIQNSNLDQTMVSGGVLVR